MSKTQRSASRSRSRSRSASRSRSRSYSRSRSRSPSRNRKRRYSSRSHSRSRSHSPAHNRERNYTREYQNNREFRGFRGSRRPFFRGRGRGYFPRGRFQRGRGGNFGNYRNNNNNWQNYRQHPQQQQQQLQQQQQQQQHNNNNNKKNSPKRGRCRSPKKRSGSPPSRSYSNDSSRRSRHSSSSSSSGASSKKRSGSHGNKRRCSRNVKEEGPAAASAACQETRKEADGDAGQEMENVEAASVEIEAEVESGEIAGEGAAGEGGAGRWQAVTERPSSSSPKKPSPLSCVVVTSGQGSMAPANQKSPSPKGSSVTSNGAPLWQGTGGADSTKSPVKKSPVSASPGLTLSRGDDKAICSVFKKFLVEQKSIQLSEFENGREDDTIEESSDIREKDLVFEKGPKVSYKFSNHNGKAAKERRTFEDFTIKASSNNYSRGPLYHEQEENGEENDEEDDDDYDQENEEMLLKSQHQMAEADTEAPRRKGKAALSARELFDLAFFHASQDASDLELLEEQLFPNRKRERAAAVAAALVRRELAGRLQGGTLSPEKGPKGRKKEKGSSSLAASTAPTQGLSWRPAESWGLDMPIGMREKSPPRMAGKRGVDSVQMDTLNDMSSSNNLVRVESERHLGQDPPQPSKKEPEVHSVFRRSSADHVCRCSTDLFSQHIVTIIHNVKAQHFSSSGMTLTDRFAVYQRRAAEKEKMKARKSPEIHRRIDVSPSAFKKHAHLFEEMKDFVESSYKAKGNKHKGDSMDLRQDIERRKKHSSRETVSKHEHGRDSGESSDSSRERPTEKISKHHKHKKSKKKRERSHSSSSSSSSSNSNRGGDYPKDVEGSKEKGFNKARLGPREHGVPRDRGRGRGGFQLRIRGRSWNRGSFQNNSNGNGPGIGAPVHSKNEERDPEYTPKSRTYYLHDDRQGDRDKKWVENRGRGCGSFVRSGGRFLFRKANPTSIASTSTTSAVTMISNNGTTNSHVSPNWTHDKFQGSAEEGEVHDDDTDLDRKEDINTGGTVISNQ